MNNTSLFHLESLSKEEHLQLLNALNSPDRPYSPNDLPLFLRWQDLCFNVILGNSYILRYQMLPADEFWCAYEMVCDAIEQIKIAATIIYQLREEIDTTNKGRNA